MTTRRTPLFVFLAMIVVISGLIYALLRLTSTDVVLKDGANEDQPISPPTVTVVQEVQQSDSSNSQVERFLLPDSSFINSPSAIGFDAAAALSGSYLAKFEQDYYGTTYNGLEMVERTYLGHSLNPRLIIALAEYQTGWVSAANENLVSDESSLGVNDNLGGFYQELYWAADRMAYGYYAHKVGALQTLGLQDGTTITIPAGMNSGTVGVYYFFSLICDQACWDQAITNNGFYTTYFSFFGDPYADAIIPLIPSELSQPTMQLPFEMEKTWSFTGGPHPAWGDGSAWAALDFAPPKEELGCIPTEEWITAVADGVIARSETALVMLDLDGDGNEQTGWNVLYYHVETADRIPAGVVVKAGDRIGHPSCEGGISTGTHVHIARKYNGEWIPADQSLPFNLDGWISSGTGNVYDGFLSRNGELVEALDRKEEENQIKR